MVWHFIGVYVVKYRTLLGRLKIQQFLFFSWATYGEKFGISTWPFEILYVFTQNNLIAWTFSVEREVLI